MKTITILTPANIEMEYRLAGVGSRLAAFVIDFLLQLAMIASVVSFIVFVIDRRILGHDTLSAPMLGAILVTVFVIHLGYFIVTELAMNGQSVGKRLFGLRAIRENGQPLTFPHILIRALFRASIDMMYVGLFTILFSKQHKRLGDMAAGTVVVSEHYLAADEFGLFAPTPELPDFLRPFAQQITPPERRVIDDWLRRKDSLPDGGEDIARRLAAYFEWKYARTEGGQ